MLKKFMLPYHKQKRIQRLVRLTAATGQEADDVATETVVERRRERAVRALLAALDQDSLKVLYDVIQSGGAYQGTCVVMPRSECKLRPKCASGVAVSLACRHFRWPDLELDSRLKRLAICRAGQDERGVCINPYHWSRVYRQDLSVAPPPAKLRCRLVSSNSPGESETVDESVTTGGTYQYGSISSLDGSGRATWCRLVYFERRQRVGQLGGWHVRAPVQHVFHGLAREDGLALDSVAGQNPQPEPDVLRTRQHIGKGVSLTLEADGVWLYNRSERPVFVSSPTLDWPAGAEAVHKLPPGHSVLAFERRRAPAGRRPAAVTVSFAKGWGPKYSRRSSAQCPCWMELWPCGPALGPPH